MVNCQQWFAVCSCSSFSEPMQIEQNKKRKKEKKRSARALWVCLLYLMWKLLPWFWSRGNRSTSCDNVCYLIWHLWHTLDSVSRHTAVFIELGCRGSLCCESAGVPLVLREACGYFWICVLFFFFFLPCLWKHSLLSPPHWIACAHGRWRETAVWKLI